MNDNTKRCRRCDTEKPKDEFRAVKSTKDGLYSYCRTCDRAHQKELRTARLAAPPKIMVPDGFKQCHSCAEVLPKIDEYFHHSSRSSDGFGGKCRKCTQLAYLKSSYIDKGLPIPIKYRPVLPGYKICSLCEEPRLLGDFAAIKKGGFMPSCRACTKTRQKKFDNNRRPPKIRQHNANRIQTDGTKWCSKCGKYKCVSLFSKSSKRSCGYSAHCNDCVRLAAIARRDRYANTPTLLPEGLTRVCTDCHLSLPATKDFFYEAVNFQYGLGAKCINCCLKRAEEYRQRNGEALKEKSRSRYSANKESINLRIRCLRASDPEFRARDLDQQKVRRLSKVFSVKIWSLKQRAKREAPWSEMDLTYQDLKAIYSRQDGRCAYCQRELKELAWEPDHVKPLSRIELSPTSKPENIVCACRRCNRNKWKRTPEEWVLRWYRILGAA